jgi:hydroxymethylbilane synthase
MSRVFTYATRRSMLALAQSRALVAAVKAGASLASEVVELQVVTTGDQIQDRPLSEVGGKGLFVKEIEEALLEHRADFAVHSMKDMPSDLPEGLVIAAVTKREDPSDAFCSTRYASLADLPAGASVGTSSLRRALSIQRYRPDLKIAPLRGNVDTRLRKMTDGEFDAIILAAAGLRRLSLEARITSLVPFEIMIPSVGQGALAIECRSDDAETLALLACVHDARVAVCVAAERGVMKALGGDCKTPIGAFAVEEDPQDSHRRMLLRAWVSANDGSQFRARSVTSIWPETPEDARRIGLNLGAELESA